MTKFEIVHLPKAQWQGHIVPIGYTTEAAYDVSVRQNESGFAVDIQKKRLEQPQVHAPEDYDFSDKLYQEFWPGACAWGVLEGGELAAAIETCPEIWSNRLRVTELWVRESHQKKGLGHALMEVAKEQARLERRRAVILETQSCNVNAIGFYLHEGFTLIGLDTCCYHNDDLARKEVRLELGWFPPRRKRLSPGEVEIRPERPEDQYAVERLTQLAFWNKYHPGCDEHYLVHRLRTHPDYLPLISRVACKDGEVLGAIFYSRSWALDGAGRSELVTFGPLCVSPAWQGCGVGELLLRETMPLAARAGYPGIVIFGEPDYYPRIGFQTCDRFGITTWEGKNFDAFLGIELIPGAMAGIHGKFQESEVFTDLKLEAVEAYNQNFPPLQKQYFPAQWD